MNQPSGTLRSVGLTVLALGAVAALILLLRAGQHMPRILVLVSALALSIVALLSRKRSSPL